MNYKSMRQASFFGQLKAVLAVVAACALVCLEAVAASSQAAPKSLYNPGFELLDAATGLPAGWSNWTNTPLTCAYTLATAHSGVASALITDLDPHTSQGLRSRRVPVQAGKRYQASAWVKITDLKAAGFAVYLEFWDGAARVQNYSSYLDRVGDWTQVKVSGTAPADATEATVLIYSSSATVGKAYFDDAALKLLP